MQGAVCTQTSTITSKPVEVVRGKFPPPPNLCLHTTYNLPPPYPKYQRTTRGGGAEGKRDTGEEQTIGPPRAQWHHRPVDTLESLTQLVSTPPLSATSQYLNNTACTPPIIRPPPPTLLPNEFTAAASSSTTALCLFGKRNSSTAVYVPTRARNTIKTFNFCSRELDLQAGYMHVRWSLENDARTPTTTSNERHFPRCLCDACTTNAIYLLYYRHTHVSPRFLLQPPSRLIQMTIHVVYLYFRPVLS